MTDGSFYLRVILQEDIVAENNTISGNKTLYTGLKEVQRPAYNNEGPHSEKIVITHQDDTKQEVIGYYIGSGREPAPRLEGVSSYE